MTKSEIWELKLKRASRISHRLVILKKALRKSGAVRWRRDLLFDKVMNGSNGRRKSQRAGDDLQKRILSLELLIILKQ